MEHRKQAPQNSVDNAVERRFAQAGLEIRNNEGGQTATLKGYALRFGSVYDMGWFTEEVSPTALQNANMSDVRVLLNHDPNNILGRTAAGTARVGVDNVGMWYEVDLPDSPNGQNARVAVQRQDITQSSWGFSLRTDDTGRRTGDKWEMRNGKEHRILTDVATVFDASPVTYPANPDTTIAKRSRDAALPEKREGGEDMGEGAPMGESGAMLEAGPADTWEIGWMMDSVAWATVTGNSTVRSLNNCIDNYGYYAKMENSEAPIFQGLTDSCMAAKVAVIAMIDAHIDALKALNAAENRGKENTAEQRENTEQQTNTSNSELLAMELELIDAQFRANKQRYEYEKICG